MEKWPRWAKTLWYAVWGIGVAGMVAAAVNPRNRALARMSSVYLCGFGFVCGLVAFCYSFRADLEPSKQFPNPKVFLRGVGLAMMGATAVSFWLSLHLFTR